jgi:predicted Mrr-cat superfamily restriction endonuclease
MVRKNHNPVEPTTDVPVDTSDEALAIILKRLKETDDRTEIRELSAQLERVIFHKQFENA